MSLMELRSAARTAAERREGRGGLVRGYADQGLGDPTVSQQAVITSTWVAWTALSRAVSEVDAPPTALASDLNDAVRPSAANSAFSSFMGTRVGTSGTCGAPSSSCTRHPESARHGPRRERHQQRPAGPGGRHTAVRGHGLDDGMTDDMASVPWLRTAVRADRPREQTTAGETRPPRGTGCGRWRHSRRAGKRRRCS